MTIAFACPSCAVTGSVAASAAGRPARCKHCGHRFTIPIPGQPEPEVYALHEPPVEAGGFPAPRPSLGSAFVPARGSEPSTAAARERQRQRRRDRKEAAAESAGNRRSARQRTSWLPWRTWLVRGGIGAAIALSAIGLLAPQGTLIVACTLMVLGSTMILAGFGVGAYAAFREDFLYGFLYLIIPLYTAYYIITRWDDLWVWFACSTTGVGLVWIGIEIARSGGVAA